jgi:hypothetical protein
MAQPPLQDRRSPETLTAAHARTLVDITEMSRRLGNVAVGTLYNWVYLRRIPFIKCGRCLRFDPEEVIRSLPHSSTMDLAGNG